MMLVKADADWFSHTLITQPSIKAMNILLLIILDVDEEGSEFSFSEAYFHFISFYSLSQRSLTPILFCFVAWCVCGLPEDPIWQI
jgi:hypothetical protein